MEGPLIGYLLEHGERREKFRAKEDGKWSWGWGERRKTKRETKEEEERKGMENKGWVFIGFLSIISLKIWQS